MYGMELLILMIVFRLRLIISILMDTGWAQLQIQNINRWNVFPNMAVGGWFDAGDFDIQTGSHNSVISSFVEAWENFKVDRDETYIDQKTRYVDIHRPDGKPDILQQIEHGTLNLVAQCENIGHPVQGIIVPNLHQYHHLGDAITETDNLPYNPNLKPYETDGKSSGTWMIAGHSPTAGHF